MLLLVPIAAAVPLAQKAVPVVSSVVGAIGGLFGGKARDDWGKASSGAVAPPNTSLPTHLYVDLPPEYKSITRVTADELLAAIEAAPLSSSLRTSRGTFGTAQDLRGALTIPNPEAVPYVGDARRLAYAAAYAAHGGVEGPMHWSNIPAGEHAVYMIGEYRKALAARPTALAGVGEMLKSSGVSPLEVGLAALSVFFLLRK